MDANVFAFVAFPDFFPPAHRSIAMSEIYHSPYQDTSVVNLHRSN